MEFLGRSMEEASLGVASPGSTAVALTPHERADRIRKTAADIAALETFLTRFPHPSEVQGEIDIGDVRHLLEARFERAVQPTLQFVQNALETVQRERAELLAGIRPVQQSTRDEVSRLFSFTRQHEIADRECLKGIRQRAQESLGTERPQQVSRRFSEELNAFVAQVYRDGVEVLEKQFHLTPPCRYCVVALGSLARGESGPYPDFDNLIVVERTSPESDRYFGFLTQYVADRIERLGESEQVGLERLGEAGQSGRAGVHICRGLSVPYTAYKFRFERTEETLRRDISALTDQIKSLEGTSKPGDVRRRNVLERTLRSSMEELDWPQRVESVRKSIKEISSKIDTLKGSSVPGDIQTCRVLEEKLRSSKDELAKLLTQKQSRKGGEEFLIDVHSWAGPPELWGDVSCGVAVFGSGRDKIEAGEEKGGDLYRDFKQSVTTLPSQEVLRRAVERQTNDMRERAPLQANPIVSETIPALIHIKEDLLRLPSVVRVLALTNGIEELSTVRCIEILREKGKLPPDVADHLIAAMNLALKWRIQVQSTYKREFELVTTRPTAVGMESFKQELTAAISQLDDRIRSLKGITPPTEESTRLLEQAEVNMRHYKELLDEDLKEINPKAFSVSDIQDLTTIVIPALKEFYHFLNRTV